MSQHDTTSLSDLDWTVRGEVYAHFAEHREAPATETLARRLGVDRGSVAHALHRLHHHHHLALFPDRAEVWIANPFSAVPTEYPVATERGHYWANCAWDALGVSAILGVDGWTETRCAGSGEPLGFGVRDGELAGDDGIIHLVVPLRDAWEDIGFT